ncbi:MAG: hypothetical protein JNM89_02175 [Hyphomicrobiaceae bacterium]|nr:hypothetical protein [Hyphomicrobiaceae bacterium]
MSNRLSTIDDAREIFDDAQAVYREAVRRIIRDKFAAVASEAHFDDIVAALILAAPADVIAYWSALKAGPEEAENASRRLHRAVEDLARREPMLFISDISLSAVFSLRMVADYRGSATDDQKRYLRRELKDGHDVEGRRREFVRLSRVLSKMDFARALKAAPEYAAFCARG